MGDKEFVSLLAYNTEISYGAQVSSPAVYMP